MSSYILIFNNRISINRLGGLTRGLFKQKIEEKTAEEWYRLGYEEKNPEKKVEYYSKCLELDAEVTTAWYNKGLAFLDLERYEEAIRCYDKYLEFEPKDTDAWENKARCHYYLKNYREAISGCDKAIESNPESVESYKLKVFSLVELDNHSEAVECFRKILEINPEDSGSWEMLGISLRKLKKWDEALESFQNAFKIEPNETTALPVATILYELKRYEEALNFSDELQRKGIRSSDLASIIHAIIQTPEGEEIAMERIKGRLKNEEGIEKKDLISRKEELEIENLLEYADKFRLLEEEEKKEALEEIEEEIFKRYQKGEEVIVRLLGYIAKETEIAEQSGELIMHVRLMDKRESLSIASTTLERIAKEDIEAIKPVIPEILALLDRKGSRSYGWEILKPIVKIMPKMISSSLPKLIEIIDTKDLEGFETIKFLGIIGEAGRNDPKAVESAIPKLSMLLEDTHGVGTIPGHAAYAIGCIAEKEPEMVRPTIQKLIKLLEDEKGYIRIHAAYALGCIGNKEAIEPLKNLFNDDSECEFLQTDSMQTVGEIAKKAVEMIKGEIEIKAEKVEIIKRSCSNCGKELKEDWITCPYCGTSLERNVCPKCGKEMEEGWKACPYCGTML